MDEAASGGAPPGAASPYRTLHGLRRVTVAKRPSVWRIEPAGESALLVTLGEAIDELVLGQVLALDATLFRLTLQGLRRPVPAYASLLCPFDPLLLTAAGLEGLIRELEPTIVPQPPSGRRAVVPVRYDGPDLARVAEHTGMAAGQVIEAHSAREYLVYAVGFAPGFTYCGELAPELATPRLPSPRPSVEPGSVGIAGRQTGIYAVQSPGGWNLIGRTGLRLFDPRLDPPARFRPGDRIRFQPVE
jgi:inhibitor of KinA